MTNEEFQRSKSFEENLREWNLLSLEEMGEAVKDSGSQTASDFWASTS